MGLEYGMEETGMKRGQMEEREGGGGGDAARAEEKNADAELFTETERACTSPRRHPHCTAQFPSIQRAAAGLGRVELQRRCASSTVEPGMSSAGGSGCCASFRLESLIVRGVCTLHLADSIASIVHGSDFSLAPIAIAPDVGRNRGDAESVRRCKLAGGLAVRQLRGREQFFLAITSMLMLPYKVSPETSAVECSQQPAITWRSLWAGRVRHFAGG